MAVGKLSEECNDALHFAVQLGPRGTRFPRISFSIHFRRSLAQRKNLRGMWETKVKQQLSLSEVNCEQMGADRQAAEESLRAPLLLSPLDPCSPAPLQAHHTGLQSQRRGGCTQVMAISPTPYPQHTGARQKAP